MSNSSNLFSDPNHLIDKYGTVGDRLFLIFVTFNSQFLILFYIFFIVSIILSFLLLIKMFRKDYSILKDRINIIILICFAMSFVSLFIYSGQKKELEHDQKTIIEGIAKRISPDGTLVNSDGDKVKNDADIAALRSLVASYKENKNNIKDVSHD